LLLLLLLLPWPLLLPLSYLLAPLLLLLFLRAG
jgi:hypothetical protein